MAAPENGSGADFAFEVGPADSEYENALPPETVDGDKPTPEAEDHGAEAQDAQAEKPDTDKEKDNLQAARRAERQAKRQLERVERELNALKEQVGQVVKTQADYDRYTVDQSAQQLANRENQLRAARRKAIADGDPDAIDQVDDELYKVRRQREKLEEVKQQVAQPRQPEPVRPATNPELDQWRTKNRWLDTASPVEYQTIAAVSAAIHNDGIDPYDPEHFEELDRRLAAVLPSRYQRQAPAPRSRPTSSPVAGSSRAGAPSAGQQQARAVPREYIAACTQAGYDMNDPATFKRMSEGYFRNKSQAQG